MVSAEDALKRLQDGNRRFAADSASRRMLQVRPVETAVRQQPFAIILGCSDSRVPAEIVFDQSLGDLFVIRVAGNIVAPSQIGSIEFAAGEFGTRLVVVLGHSACGAVRAAVEEMQAPVAARSRNLQTIIDFVRPSVEAVMAAGGTKDQDQLVERSVRENIRRSVRQLHQGSEILGSLVANDGLRIIGAEYSLDTGLVRFLPELED